MCWRMRLVVGNIRLKCRRSRRSFRWNILENPFNCWRKKNVVKTSPVAQGKPGILRAPLTVPQGKKTSLTVTAGRNVEAKADWQLVVKVGTETLHQSLVDEKTATEGWVTQVVDLSKFAGKNIVVEVHNNPTNWHYEQAYWSQVAIESK
jgi:hypothetical protein